MKKEDAADNLKILIESTTITSQFALIFSILVVCAFSEGFCQAANLLIGPYIESPFNKHITDSALKSSFFVGLVASIGILEVIDSWRPRIKIALMVFALVVGSAAFWLHKSVYSLIIGNTFLGLAVGGTSLVAMFVTSEICSKTYRAIIFTWVWMFVPFGEVVGCILFDAMKVLDEPSKIYFLTKMYIFGVFP